MRLLLVRSAIANLAFVLCILVASLLPGLWEAESGRDFIPQAVNASVLILIVAFSLRRRSRWPLSHLLAALIPTQIILLLGISAFSGYTGTHILDTFNLEWLLTLDLFIALPWVIGVTVGSLVRPAA